MQRPLRHLYVYSLQGTVVWPDAGRMKAWHLHPMQTHTHEGAQPKEFHQRLCLLAATQQPALTCAAPALIAPVPTVVLAIAFLCAGDTLPVVALEAVS